MSLYRRKDVYEKCQKLQVTLGILTRSKQLSAAVCSQRPVVMFTRTIDAFERFFVQQYDESVLTGNLGHEVHDHLVLIICKICFSVDRSEFELVRGDFVVPCLDRDAKAVTCYLKIPHEGSDSGRNGTKIMVIKLLVFGRIMAHQGTSCNHQVGSGGIEGFIDKEVLLLPAQIGKDLLY